MLEAMFPDFIVYHASEPNWILPEPDDPNYVEITYWQAETPYFYDGDDPGLYPDDKFLDSTLGTKNYCKNTKRRVNASIWCGYFTEV
jgi:hypothetical protein